MSAHLVGWGSAVVASKAAVYGLSLTAAGGVIFLLVFRGQVEPDARRAVAWSTVGLALTAAAASGAQIVAQAGFLGETGDVPWPMVHMVASSPIGSSAAVRLAGLALIPAILLGGHRGGLAFGVLGALLTCTSFTVVGHTADVPLRLLVAAVLAIHLLAVAYWIGALWPLLRVMRGREIDRAAIVLKRFGQIAVGVVAVLLAAGAALAWSLLESPASLWRTGYGRMLALKLVLVVGLLTLAALNKLRLVPAFAAGQPAAASSLRRSILAEILLASAIVTVTAALTTLVSPDGLEG